MDEQLLSPETRDTVQKPTKHDEQRVPSQQSDGQALRRSAEDLPTADTPWWQKWQGIHFMEKSIYSIFGLRYLGRTVAKEELRLGKEQRDLFDHLETLPYSTRIAGQSLIKKHTKLLVALVIKKRLQLFPLKIASLILIMTSAVAGFAVTTFQRLDMTTTEKFCFTAGYLLLLGLCCSAIMQTEKLIPFKQDHEAKIIYTGVLEPFLASLGVAVLFSILWSVKLMDTTVVAAAAGFQFSSNAAVAALYFILFTLIFLLPNKEAKLPEAVLLNIWVSTLRKLELSNSASWEYSWNNPEFRMSLVRELNKSKSIMETQLRKQNKSDDLSWYKRKAAAIHNKKLWLERPERETPGNLKIYFSSIIELLLTAQIGKLPEEDPAESRTSFLDRVTNFGKQFLSILGILTTPILWFVLKTFGIYAQFGEPARGVLDQLAIFIPLVLIAVRFKTTELTNIILSFSKK
ncbi:hypothetical protein [Gloeobacter morelensis]|uniref:Uncharacterized protein n=1 Tax=Gloeobacter morelensis MG652769 TaxID=2781736 RepID=A0ABY3PJW4_9CYAN|nr:hypothetical protein [Gloeobacter morelensis]UFP93955.1 hypothetical protein ISF26_19635 [Gloeobacter morelensis MG652769]